MSLVSPSLGLSRPGHVPCFGQWDGSTTDGSRSLKEHVIFLFLSRTPLPAMRVLAGQPTCGVWETPRGELSCAGRGHPGPTSSWWQTREHTQSMTYELTRKQQLLFWVWGWLVNTNTWYNSKHLLNLDQHWPIINLLPCWLCCSLEASFPETFESDWRPDTSCCIL